MGFITNDKLDFVSVHKKETKSGFILEPELSVIKRDCLMTRGHAFYAVWDFEFNTWSFDELRVPILINMLVQEAFDNLPEHEKPFTTISDIGRFRTSEWSSFKAYCKQLPDKSHDLDTQVTFADEFPSREDYRARKLPYSLSHKQPRSYLKLMSVLYDPEELEKLEWAVGLCLCGEQSLVHKFIALFGGSGTGKSTFLNIVDMLFQGYTETVNVHNIVSGKDFALSRFASNPLVIIEHDCNLGKIHDNSRLNSMISHEKMEINVKNQSMYTARILGMMFLGTNKPIHITDARSGIARRLIDVSPSGRLLPLDVYNKLMNDIQYELGSIAYHCINVYRTLGRGYYANYVPIKMMVKTNVFYSFIMENANELDDENGITLTRAYNLYKKYCEDYSVKNPLDKTSFRDEIEEYFLDITVAGSGKYQTQVIYKGLNPKMLKYDQYVKQTTQSKKTIRSATILDEAPSDLIEQDSLFDELRADCKAQYTNSDGTPILKWTDVTSTLSSINTKELHFVRLPKNHIVVDLDLKDENGEKNLALNLEAAKAFPETYMEVSKSGKGLHLHYIYDGDVSLLDRCPQPNIEVKVFTGKSALRRKLTLCNNVPIATISSGLKLKEKKNMTPLTQIKDEKHLRSLILKGLKRQVHANTRPSIDFIKKTIEDAVAAGVKFDVSDLYPQLITFAAGSSHQSDYCIEVVRGLTLCTIPEPIDIEIATGDDTFLVYDIECFKNLFMLSFTTVTLDELKQALPTGKLSKKNLKKAMAAFADKLMTPERVKTLVNPSADEISWILDKKMVAFNNRRYDNHILYARCMGESNMQCYLRSRAIIDGARDVMSAGYIPSAWNMSFLDLYELATTKQSLKKWEVELGLPHMECCVDWNEDVPEEKWETIGVYNRNDVVATVCLFAHLVQTGEYAARQILANISKKPLGTTLRNHFAQIIFQGDKNPQKEFIYTDLSTLFPGYTYEVYTKANTTSDADTGEVDEEFSKVKVKSEYMDTDPSEGGRVYTEPGVYDNVALLDVESMHPASIIALNLFGTHYTQRYKAVRDIRVALKHSLDTNINSADYLRTVAEKERNEHNADIYESALEIVTMYADDRSMIKNIVTALKLGLNSTYGWTAASFPNPFRDPRNVDNIVAKCGALFMITLQYELQNRGVQVVHVKTDSIKIPGATRETIDFIMDFAKQYQYTFAHEDTYVRMCLINKAVYICFSSVHQEWEATGAQFAHPIVYKKLFSKEELEFEDFIETKEVKGEMWMSYNGESLDRFIGRIGEFVAVHEDMGGDILRVSGDKRGHVSGTKGYKWEEVDRVDQNINNIDWNYYNTLVQEAAEAIETYMPLDEFLQIDDIPYNGPYVTAE